MNGIFMNTIQLIGSIILFGIFISISYGIFTGTLEEMLWNLFYSILEILKPIISIVLLVLCAIKAPSWIESLINSMLEDMRTETAEIKFWAEFEKSPPPQENTQNNTTQPIKDQINEPSPGVVGEEVIIWQPVGNGAIAHHVRKGTPEYQEKLKLQYEQMKEMEEKEIQEAVNNMHRLRLMK